MSDTPYNLFSEEERNHYSQIGKPSDSLKAGIIDILTQFDSEHIKEVIKEVIANGQLDALINSVVGEVISGSICTLSNTVIKEVPSLDRRRTLEQILEGTGYRPFVNGSVLKTMPLGGNGVEENIVVVFFRVGRCLSGEEAEWEYNRRGLEPDPLAQAAVNAADPNFARDYPNGTQWDRKGQEVSYITFQHWPLKEARMSVQRSGNAWGPTLWLAGVRKKQISL